MFCYQCEETMNGTGCTINGMCGKKGEIAVLQDRLIYALKGYAFCNSRGRLKECNDPDFGPFVMEALFSTLTNVNFDGAYFESMIRQALQRRDTVRDAVHNGAPPGPNAPDAATITYDELMSKTDEIGVLSVENEDVRSLREIGRAHV